MGRGGVGPGVGGAVTAEEVWGRGRLLLLLLLLLFRKFLLVFLCGQKPAPSPPQMKKKKPDPGDHHMAIALNQLFPEPKSCGEK